MSSKKARRSAERDRRQRDKADKAALALPWKCLCGATVDAQFSICLCGNLRAKVVL
jgi:hypothetical protein